MTTVTWDTGTQNRTASGSLHVIPQSEYLIARWRGWCSPSLPRRGYGQTMQIPRGVSIKRIGRVCVLLSILLATESLMHAEPSWPRLTPELWQEMTPAGLERLLSEGSGISERDGVGMTALMRAAQHSRDPRTLRLLIDTGARVDIRDEGGWTPLMRAARSNPNPEIHATLIEAGADVNARNMADYTALIWATRENPNPEVVLLLLDAGANPTLRGVDGRRAVEFLAENPALLGTRAEARLKGR